MTLTDFLLARIAEDEAVAIAMRHCADPLDWTADRDWPPAIGLAGPVDGPSGYESIVIDPARVSAECEAKRRIVGTHQTAAADWALETADCMEYAMQSLAMPYADHPDYREEWRP